MICPHCKKDTDAPAERAQFNVLISNDDQARVHTILFTHKDSLKENERDFLSKCNKYKYISGKMAAWLAKILERYPADVASVTPANGGELDVF